MLNYLVLRYIFGTGNLITHYNSLSFYLKEESIFFLDKLRSFDPVLFVVVISGHVSLLMGLLNGVSYALSFYTRQKIVISFQVMLMMILLEVVLSMIGLSNLSIVKQLQPFSMFTVKDVIIVYSLLTAIVIGLIAIANRGKDFL